MSSKQVKLLILSSVLLVVAMIISLGIGRYYIPPLEVTKILFSKVIDVEQTWPNSAETVIFTIRIPRILANVLVGVSLALAGAVYQSIFQNQLVSSDILGVSNGASVGAALAMIFGANAVLLQTTALTFGLLTVAITLLLARLLGTKNNLTLVLSGLIISGFMSSFLSLLKYVADPYAQLPAIVYWLMGSMAGIQYKDVISIMLPVIFSILIIFLMSWRVNIISLGENEAKLLGMNVQRIRLISIVAATLLTACAISISGVIGWFGLMVPHLCRLIVGDDNRILFPFTAVVGGILMIVMDTIARTLLETEIPLGIITGTAGTIAFAIIIIKKRARFHEA